MHFILIPGKWNLQMYSVAKFHKIQISAKKEDTACFCTSCVMIVEDGDIRPNIVGITRLLAMMIGPQIQASWNIQLVVYTVRVINMVILIISP